MPTVERLCHDQLHAWDTSIIWILTNMPQNGQLSAIIIICVYRNMTSEVRTHLNTPDLAHIAGHVTYHTSMHAKVK